jgi:hypothetical protein
MLSSWTNLSLMGVNLGLNLVPDLAGAETPAAGIPVTGPTGLAANQIPSPENTSIPGQLLPNDHMQPGLSTALDSVHSQPQEVGQNLYPDLPPLRGQNRVRTLWYNGDYDGRNGLASEMNTLVADARTYDDFNVTSHHGWDVTHVWGNFQLMSTNVEQANFEIRSGVSSGNGGTVVASGSNMPATLTLHPVGRFLDITVDIALDTPIHLDPGTYWLNVQPIGFGAGRSFVSTTGGNHCVKTPCGNNGNSFFDSHTFPFTFRPTNDPQLLGNGTWDFSYGVGGMHTQPE